MAYTRHTDHAGRRIEVEFDGTPVFWHRARLIVEGRVADDRGVFCGTTTLRAAEPMTLAVDATVGFFGAKRAVLREANQVAVNEPLR